MPEIKLPEVLLSDYHYDLPEENIAKFPAEPRDSAKLLFYKNSEIKHYQFKDLTGLIDQDYTLYFNNTKVLPARLYFRKETGALIEIFLFNPIAPTNDVSQAMIESSGCIWKCTIGNLKKWKADSLKTQLNVQGTEVIFEAELIDREEKLVKFHWNQANLKFVDIVNAAGETPLPPYIKRDIKESDKERYQTVYCKKEGAVAAPTAGLHFTDHVIDQLRAQGNQLQELTLHVSAGTFKPVTSENVVEHEMHNEQMIVTKENILAILKSNKVASVGTTSMRTLESLYWYGVKLLDGTASDGFLIEKLYPYERSTKELPSKEESFKAILNEMESNGLNEIHGETSIFIMPGYRFQVVDALITNYHLPSTTLVLLVAAFIGDDWRKIYDEALNNNYRFLSFGDSSILFRN